MPHEEKKIKPIIRWAGGKIWLLKYLQKFLPTSFKNFHEPFLGGASVFLHIQPNGISFLSDSNMELINTYCQIRDKVEELILELRSLKNTEIDYYKIRRKKFNNPIKRAARFLYLNRTCYNGLYRVNLIGEFNVPYGFKSYKKLFDYDKLREISKLLKSAIISNNDFELCLKNIKEGDLVFLDPPYTTSHNNNQFIKYNEKIFTWEDQQRLASFIEKIIERNSYFILTNAKHENIKKLFSRIISPITLSRSNTIGGRNAKRGIIEEYLFTNCI